MRQSVMNVFWVVVVVAFDVDFDHERELKVEKLWFRLPVLREQTQTTRLR